MVSINQIHAADGLLADSFARVQGVSHQTVDGVLLDFGGGGSLMLAGLMLDQLSADDFTFTCAPEKAVSECLRPLLYTPGAISPGVWGRYPAATHCKRITILFIRLNLYRTRASAPLIVALGIQTLAALFLFGETLTEFEGQSGRVHSPAELTVALALAIAIVLSIRELRLVLRRSDERASALDVVRETFARVLNRQFDLWKLTPAERIIARLSLGGLDVDEISRIRGSALGPRPSALGPRHDQGAVRADLF